MEQTIIESVTKIGNKPSLVKLLEPNISSPQKLEEWMVARSLAAYCMLIQEVNKIGDTKS